MIFITLGSQKFPFDRLLKAVDALAAEGTLTEPVFAQTGCSTYVPTHYDYKPFMDREEFARAVEEADIVITHGGTGAIVGALKKGKKVIAVARKAKFGEHVDDHQEQIVNLFRDAGLLCALEDCGQLAQALEQVRVQTFRPYQSSTQGILDSIDRFIRG